MKSFETSQSSVENKKQFHFFCIIWCDGQNMQLEGGKAIIIDKKYNCDMYVYKERNVSYGDWLCTSYGQ